MIIVCTSDFSQAGEHLYHAPNDAVWSRLAPDRPAGENVNASRSDRRQHVSERIIRSLMSCVGVTTQPQTNMSNLGCLSQRCSALFVGDGNVPLLRHRHVPSDTAPLGGIHRQHRGGPVFAQTPGMLVFASLACQLTNRQKRSQPLCLCVRGVLWMQSTSRERQRFMLQRRGAGWRCAGLCCREQGAGCSMRRATAASHHWTSANRGKHSGECSD